MVNSCNYSSYIDQLNLYFYSHVRVLWFLSITKTQISMNIKFHTFIQRRQRRNTAVFFFLPRQCDMELIVNEKFEEIWKHAVIHKSGPILKFTWWCREKDRKCIHTVTLTAVRILKPENFLRLTYDSMHLCSTFCRLFTPAVLLYS
jgi:hypothetical protein